MPAVTSATSRRGSGGTSLRVDPGQLANTRYHIETLLETAEAERLAALGRRHHREEHEAHPTFEHPHPTNGVRRALGHALIVVGAAIAGSRAEHGARRAA